MADKAKQRLNRYKKRLQAIHERLDNGDADLHGIDRRTLLKIIRLLERDREEWAVTAENLALEIVRRVQL